MNLALLVIDMQIGFVGEDKRKDDVKRVSEYINYVAGIVREGGGWVVHVQDVDVEGGKTSPNYEIVPEIERAPQDLFVSKKRPNSFWETELESLLRDRGIRNVIVSGFAAEHCVLFTYNGAAERGFRPAILQHGVLGERDASVDALYRDRQVISYGVVKWLLEGETQTP